MNNPEHINELSEVTSDSPISNIISFIESKYEVLEDPSEEKGNEKSIAFIRNGLKYIVDIYRKTPRHLRVYVLFNSSLNKSILNDVNAEMRFAKATSVNNTNQKENHKKESFLCIEVEQMMFGEQDSNSAEEYLEFSIRRINKCIVKLLEYQKEQDEKEKNI